MMESLRTLKLRMKSVENTRKITRAMEMVSASKLNRVKSILFQERPYFEKLESMVMRLLSAQSAREDLFLNRQSGNNGSIVCVITSDAGLCSIYNHSVIRLVENFISAEGRENIRLITMGREGYNHFRRHNFPVINNHPQIYGRYTDTAAKILYDEMTGLFLGGEAGEVYIAYTHFTSTLRLKPLITKFLTIECGKPNQAQIGYITEPDYDTLMKKILPSYLFEKVRLILLDAFTSEHASRMIAMRMATDNASNLIDSLTLSRNKARQAAITKDILEVVMSAEALKGQ